jgi:hypothetical protein
MLLFSVTGFCLQKYFFIDNDGFDLRLWRLSKKFAATRGRLVPNVGVSHRRVDLNCFGRK